MKDYAHKEWLDRDEYRPTFLSELGETIAFVLLIIGFILFLSLSHYLWGIC